MTTPVLTEPLAVWDARERSWMVRQRQARTDWLKAHGLPANEMYRAEFYLLDAPFVRVFTYHRDERGKLHWNEFHKPDPHNHDLCGIAVNPAYEEPIWELPPDELR